MWSRTFMRYARLRETIHFDESTSPRLRISVVVGQGQSVNYIASLIKSESTAYQVIIVDDFSEKQSLLRDITQYFGLFKTSYTSSGELPQEATRTLLRSHKRLFSKVIVVDSAQSKDYTPFEVGAVISSYNYNLQIYSRRTLRVRAIENLLLELALRPEGSVEKITSMFGERIKLICREAALPEGVDKIKIDNRKSIKIKYRILK
ncbi:MAG: hypothetical protein SNI49_04035 [Rikenellaceae bacterium]